MNHKDLKDNDRVIFERYDDILENYTFQDGYITNIYPSEEESDVFWLQEDVARCDSVKYNDIIAKYDEIEEKFIFWKKIIE